MFLPDCCPKLALISLPSPRECGRCNPAKLLFRYCWYCLRRGHARCTPPFNQLSGLFAAWCSWHEAPWWWLVVGKEPPFQGLFPRMLAPAWGTGAFPMVQLCCTAMRFPNDLHSYLIALIMGAESKNPGRFFL